MALSIHSGNNIISIDQVSFNREDNRFECYSKEPSNHIFSYDLPFKLDDLPSAELTENIYFFKNDFINNFILL